MKNIIEIKSTDKNATPLVMKALADCRNDCENIIRFERGQYTFAREGCLHDTFYVSNNASGEKDVVFPIIGKKNVTIDGSGSEFVFTNRIFPFVIQQSEQITLANFTVDFSFARHFEGVIARSDEDGFELAVDRERFGFRCEDGRILFNAGEDVISTGDCKLFIRGMKSDQGAAYIFAGDSTESKVKLAAPFMETDASETESGLCFKFREGSFKKLYPVGAHMFIGNDEGRINDVIFAEDSCNLRISDVTMLRGAGMGLIAQICENIDVERLTVIPHEGEELSITADIIHCVNCSGRLTLRQCKFERSIDDAINVHGVYSIVDSVDENRVKIRFEHPGQQGIQPYKIGDRLHISSPESMDEIGFATVLALECDEARENIVLTLDGYIPELGDIIENPDRMPELTMEDCEVVHCPHMRLSSKKMTLRRCKFALDNADVYICDLFEYWYESGAIGDMLIEDCDFTQLKRNTILVCSTRKPTSARRHGSLTVRGCRFAAERETAIATSYIDRVEVEYCEFGVKFD